MIWTLFFAAFAAFLGYHVGARRERGAHERIVAMEAEQSFEDYRRGGIRLRRIQIRR